MIEIKNLYKNYGEKVIYNDLSLSLEEGKITCLLGSSGSGKTTLLNIIAGLTKFRGDVPKLRCSYIFQNVTLVPNLTVRGNLALVCKNDAKIDEMIEKVGLIGRGDDYPVNLSGGEAQRVAIARAFLYESDILLMDEPFASLDIKLKLQIFKLFFDMWREDGRTVLMVTHDIDEAEYAAERVMVLEDGKIVFDYTPQSPVPREFYRGGVLRDKLIGLMINSPK